MKKNVVLKDFRGAARTSGTIEYGGEKDFISLRSMQSVFEVADGKIRELSPEPASQPQTAKNYCFSLPYGAIDFIVCVCDGEPFYFSPDDKANYTEVKRIYEDFVKTASREAEEHKAYEYDDYAVAEDDYYKNCGTKFVRNGEKVNVEHSQNDDAQKMRQRKEIETESKTCHDEYAEDDESRAESERLSKIKSLAVKIAFSGGKSKLSDVIPFSLWLKEGDGLIGIVGEKFSPSYFVTATAITRADFFGRENNLYPESSETCRQKGESASVKKPLGERKFFIPESVFSPCEYGFSVTFENLKA